MSTAIGGIRVGDIEIARLTEWSGRLFARTQLLPASSRRQWLQEADWLVPRYWDPVPDEILAALQIHVIRSGTRILIVDTEIGNAKHRPSTPALDHLRTPFLQRLRGIGVAPEAVDTVVCTHLHPDHIGWNTHRSDSRWRPTFPNARYLLPRADYAMMRRLRPERDSMNYRDAFADSVEPVIEAGQAVLWDGQEMNLATGVTLLATPGHSPGAAVVVIESATQTAILSGDIVHHPMQILDPDQPTAFDADPAAAIASRRRILEMASDRDAVMLPAHFPGAGVPRIRAEGNAFAIRTWVQMSSGRIWGNDGTG